MDAERKKFGAPWPGGYAYNAGLEGDNHDKYKSGETEIPIDVARVTPVKQRMGQVSVNVYLL
jgi:hypothetical protein